VFRNLTLEGDQYRRKSSNSYPAVFFRENTDLPEKGRGEGPLGGGMDQATEGYIKFWGTPGAVRTRTEQSFEIPRGSKKRKNFMAEQSRPEGIKRECLFARAVFGRDVGAGLKREKSGGRRGAPSRQFCAVVESLEKIGMVDSETRAGDLQRSREGLKKKGADEGRRWVLEFFLPRCSSRSSRGSIASEERTIRPFPWSSRRGGVWGEAFLFYGEDRSPSLKNIAQKLDKRRAKDSVKAGLRRGDDVTKSDGLAQIAESREDLTSKEGSNKQTLASFEKGAASLVLGLGRAPEEGKALELC